MECLKLISSVKFPEKRVGYLGLTQLLDENTEILMLVTNSIKNDLLGHNQFVTGLALGGLGNIANPEMCQALAGEVEKLLTASNPYIRKKAALCAMRMVRKNEDLEDKFNHRIGGLVEDSDHAVALCGCSLLIAVVDTYPEYTRDFRKHIGSLMLVLKGILSSSYSSASEYDVSGVTDPFLQVKILRVLRVLGQGSVDAADDMNYILAQVATNTEGTKNAGNAILYECVQTIMAIEAESGLRVLGINILGRFLLNHDPNIRYVALTTLQKVVRVDLKAVQRHRDMILDCLKADNDPSIRKRALDVAYALVNEDNVKNMTKELQNHLITAESDGFKDDLVMRICACIEQHAPNRRWQVDNLIRVMCLAGDMVPPDVRSMFCHIVASTPELHAYTVHKLYFSLTNNAAQEALQHVGIWCVGEFGDLLCNGTATGPDDQPIQVTPADILDLLQGIIKQPATKGTKTHELIASCLMKLAARFPGELERIRKMMRKFETSLSAELQQRACEYSKLMESDWDSCRADVLDRMPVCDKPLGGASDVGEVAAPSISVSNGAAGQGDLLDLDVDALLNSDPVPAAAPPAVPAASNDLLDDVFGIGGPSPSASAPTPSAAPVDDLLGGFFGDSPPAPVAAAKQYPDIVAFSCDELRVIFAIAPGSAPGATQVQAIFANLGSVPLTNFVFQAAVPKYLTLAMETASTAVLAPRTERAGYQVINVTNSTNGARPIMMKLRIQYTMNGQAVVQQGQVSNFPQGL